MNLADDLTLQWQHLCQGIESPADVEAALSQWGRECIHLPHGTALEQVPHLLWTPGEASDAIARYLVARANAGDHIAHHALLHTYLARVLQGRPFHEWPELINTLWLLVLSAPHGTDAHCTLWLAMRTRHLHISHDHKREVPVDSSTANELRERISLKEMSLDLGDEVTGNLHVDHLLGQLSHADNDLLRLRFVDGLTLTAAANMMGLTPAAASKRQNRALNTLRGTRSYRPDPTPHHPRVSALHAA